MKRLLSALLLFSVHFAAKLFYRVEMEWISAPPDPWQVVKKDLRVVAFLNHTSLFEPVFAAGLPLHVLWYLAGRAMIPGADITLRRPIVGTFYRLLTPITIPISRKRDGTWDYFLSQMRPGRVVMLAPEGRMKRRNGLDKKGEPMSVRGGIADILHAIPSGTLLIAYSGGLHHIQAPGDKFPRLFQTAKMRLQIVDIAEYKKQMQNLGVPFKMAVVKDLEERMRRFCPA